VLGNPVGYVIEREPGEAPAKSNRGQACLLCAEPEALSIEIVQMLRKQQWPAVPQDLVFLHSIQVWHIRKYPFE
jgi:hypothetical protein